MTAIVIPEKLVEKTRLKGRKRVVAGLLHRMYPHRYLSLHSCVSTSFNFNLVADTFLSSDFIPALLKYLCKLLVLSFLLLITESVKKKLNYSLFLVQLKIIWHFAFFLIKNNFYFLILLYIKIKYVINLLSLICQICFSSYD